MSKRAGGPLESAAKRKQYTHGPLDETFGQHAAFALEAPETPDDALAQAYLALVRAEAEAEPPFYSVRKEKHSKKAEAATETIIPQETVDREVRRLLAAKQEVGESNDTDTDEHVPETAAQWRALVFSEPPPSMSYFFNVLEHTTVVTLIVHYTKWLSHSMPPTLGEWIFATFVRLDKALDALEVAFVRALGKKARKLRADPKSANLPQASQDTLTTVLALVGCYYGQGDLLHKPA